MRNIFESAMQRMSFLAKDGVLLLWGLTALFGIMFVPQESQAAIGTTTQNWPATPIYSAAGYPSAAITYNAVAGNNRLLVVGISSSTTAVNQPQPTVTYGGAAMTYAIGTNTTATSQHSYLFYRVLGSSATADTGKTIVITMSGGTSRHCIVNAAVYTGVDQTTPIGGAIRSSNNTTASNVVGPFTSVVASGELGVSVLNAVTTARTNAATIAIGTTGHLWTQVSTAASGKLLGALRTTFATTTNVNTVTATQHSSSAQGGATTLNSTAAMTLKPVVGITVNNGSSVAGNKAVYANDGANSNNVVVDAFSIVADSAMTVSSITFTANANSTSANLSAIRIWRKVGANLTAYETGDAQVGADATATGGAVTFSGFSETVSPTAKNYIVTYDIAAGATASSASVLTGTITAITPTAIALTDTSAFSASVYIYPTTTLGTGSEPSALRLWKGSAATNLDAFTLGHNSSTSADDDIITNVTATLTPQYISGGSGGTISKIKLIEVVNSAGTTVYGSSTAATSGDVWNISTVSPPAPSPMTVTSSPITYYLRISTADTITPSVTDTSGTPEGYYTFNGRLTTLAHTKANNKLVLNDSASQTLTIDVEIPTGPATATATTGALGGEINLVWDNATDPNGGALDTGTPFVVRRSAPDGTTPSPGCIDGTNVTLTSLNQSSRSLTDTGLIDTTPTRYYYRVCAKDAQGNLSTGATSYANAKVTSVCNLPPTVTLTGNDGTSTLQIIKTDTKGVSDPFRLQIANNDIGVCPDVGFIVELANVVGNDAHFTKTVDGGAFPGTITLGTGGGGASTGKTVPVVITGIEAEGALQIEQYTFAIRVSSPGNNHGAPITTGQVTGMINDMPPIVHNSNNMAKYQYGTWGSNYTCATCHSNSTTNIKGVYQIISTPIGRRNVVFTKISSTPTDFDGVFGNDQRDVKNGSNMVCSVCHHQTRQHQYSANKTFGGPSGLEPYISTHYNSADCAKCHTHNTAFKSIYGLCGDCHGFKATGYSPVSRGTMVKDMTNALGPSPPNYGAHQRHNIAKMTCDNCHSNTNHGKDTTAWLGDTKLEIGFKVNKDTYPGFNPLTSAIGGIFYGTNNLNQPYTWLAGERTTITPIADYNASCSTYCHGAWGRGSGYEGSIPSPIWVGTEQTACGTCHYATGAVPPTSGSHAKHSANTGPGLGIACTRCHATYSSYTGSAHLNGNVEWKLSNLGANASYKGLSSGSTGNKAPTDPANYGSCANMYCHSNVQGDDGTGLPTYYATPTWNGVTTCSSCHPANPNTSGSHISHENATVAFDCHVCHNTGGTTSPLNHANGNIDFQFVGLGANTQYGGGVSSVPAGSGYKTCSVSDCHGRYTRAWGTPASGLDICDKCHGSATSPNGFYNTRGPDGTLSIYSTGIGVHDIHLQNPDSPRKTTFARFTSYAKGFKCWHCHSVPTGPFTAGHIDNPLPAEVPFSHISSIANYGLLKFSYYSSPQYSSGTCSAVWCHGAGMNSNYSKGPYAGLASGIQRQNPSWYSPILTGNGANDCVKCHAMPPPAPDSSYIHYGKTLATCQDCHTHLSNDGLGFVNKKLHVNGVIDGGCDKCHGYPPVTNLLGPPDGLATPEQGALRLGTAGAHNAHVLNPYIGKDCKICHNNYTDTMPSNNLELGFKAYNNTVVSGTFTGYSSTGVHPNWVSRSADTLIQEVTAGANVCSNLYCHGGGAANLSLPALGGGSKTNPNWEGGSAEVACGTCHGADNNIAAPSGGSHTKHALITGGGPGIQCINCHMNSTNMTHVDGAVSFRYDRSNPLIGAGAVYDGLSSGKIVGLAPRNSGGDYRSCANFYCHSDVQGANGIGAPTYYGTPQWGNSASIHCGSCHKDMATDAAATGSHKKHANTGSTNMALSCGYCHQDGGDGSLNHADNVIFTNFTSYVGGTYSNNGRTAGDSAGYGTCSATFCHGTAASPAWGAAGPLPCYDCHSASADRATSPSWSGRHVTHYNYSTPPSTYNDTLNRDLSNTTKYRFNCTHCHDADSTKHSLKPYSSSAYARVFFGISGSVGTSARRGKYAYGAAQGATDNGFKYTAGSCNTSYCHSDGKKGTPLVTALTWITPKTGGSNCLYCHDGKSITATASKLSPRHDEHMNRTNNPMIGIGNTGFNCVDCHAKIITNADNLTITNKTNHVTGMVDYSGAKAGKTFDYSTKVCSNVYCHSNGNPNALVFVSMTGSKVWTGAGATGTITTCNKCHGRSTTTGYPDYANGGASTATSNLHAGHMAGMTDTKACADCHRKTGDTTSIDKFRPYSTLHMTGVPNVYFNTAKTYIGTKANVATNGFQVTCSQIVCHGQGAPVWGTSTSANTCQKCHGSRAQAFQTYSSPQVAPGYGSDGTDTSMTKKAPTDPRVGAHQRHLTSNAIASVVKCGECHVTVTAIRSGNHWNYSTATLTFNGRATANAHTPSVSRTGGLMQCSNTNCHTGKYNSGTTIAPFWNVTGLVKESGTTVAACVKCHAMAPSGYASHPAALNNFSSFRVVKERCQGCHSNISSSGTNVSNIFVDKNLHVNGTIDASGSHAFPYPGSIHDSLAVPIGNCTSCHTNTSGTYPVTRPTKPDCRGCHKNASPGTAGAGGCSACHGRSTTGGVAGNYSAARPNGGIAGAFPNYSGSHRVHVVTKGYACTGCHNGYGTGSAKHGFSNTSGSTYSRTNFKQMSFTIGGTPTYTRATMTCSNLTGCHGTAVWGGRITCIQCHDSSTIVRTKAGGYTMSNVVAEFNSTWSHTNTKGTVTAADCIVCHLEGDMSSQSTTAKHGDGYLDLRDHGSATNDVAITDLGGSAISFKRFSTSFATGTRTSTVVNTAIRDVVTRKFCLGCHKSGGSSNATAGQGGIVAGGSKTQPFGSAGGTVLDINSQFATSNSSKHPVLGPLSRDYPTATRMANPYKPAGTRGTSGTKSNGVIMNCFDCHNTDTGALLTHRTVSAHGNAVTLRGTYGGAAPTFCTACHLGYTAQTSDGHNTASGFTSGSAFSCATDRMGAILDTCNYCHASSATAARPDRAVDTHGTNTVPAGTKTNRWALTNGKQIPVAFIRNINNMTNHQPKNVTGTAYAPQCDMIAGEACGSRAGSPYSLGGTY